MSSHCVLIACVTALIISGCNLASNEELPSGIEAISHRVQERAVRDTRLLGTWYPASCAANYMVAVSNHMLLIYDEDTLNFFEIEVTRNEQPSTGQPRIEGVKLVGRYNHQRTTDGNVLLRFDYDENDDHLRLIRTWPPDVDESVCPSRIEVVRVESTAPEGLPASSISARQAARSPVSAGSEIELRTAM
jgi:hypothetical protein